jgi:antirestriction protein ArdC
MSQNVIFEKVNEAVIKGLKRDGFDWFKPWKAGAENQPMNRAKKTYYNGFNIFMLNAVMMDKGYEYNQWLTYKQCVSLEGSVKKGSKSTSVYICKIGRQDMKTGKFLTEKQIKTVNLREKMTTETGKVINRYRPTFTWKYWNVFNIAQCEGIEPIDIKTEKIVHEPIEAAEQLTSSYISNDGKLKLQHGGDRAYYHTVADRVQMPKPENFCDSDSYYKVLFHELAHSTGHESRLNRKSLTEVSMWGDETYAQEELVAEISAMYITGMLGLNPKESVSNSQAYIKGWCRELEDKPKACLFAMQQATKVVKYIQG